MPAAPAVSRYLAIFAAAVILATTWRVFPLFKDTVRVEGHVLSLEEYVADNCAERVGPAAASCREATIGHGRRLVASQQAKALLLVEAPLLAYVLIYLPYRAITGRLRRSREQGAAERVAAASP